MHFFYLTAFISIVPKHATDKAWFLPLLCRAIRSCVTFLATIIASLQLPTTRFKVPRPTLEKGRINTLIRLQNLKKDQTEI